MPVTYKYVTQGIGVLAKRSELPLHTKYAWPRNDGECRISNC
jgi:hypothetical protein